MGKYLALISILICTICHLLILFAKLSTSPQGAIGKCTSLFKFFGSIMNERVRSSPAIANDVQFDLDLPRMSPNEETRKRRVDDHSPGPELVQAGGSRSDEVVKTQDNLFSITKVPVPSLKPSEEKASETLSHNSAAASAQILEYKRLQQAHSQPRSEENQRTTTPTIPFHNSTAVSAKILEYKRLQQAHSQLNYEDNKITTSLTYEQPPYHSSNNI